ncbi:unnamed protein product [Urochloa decumbens]|uniref:Phospholipase A1 n=1 Tax=Urochloa decumbens TaxID=240449 RepID=A0ABC9GFZ8_9POAL
MASSAVTEIGNGNCNAGETERWPKLQGEHSWDGLLDPLDMDLRKSLISYGELVSATGCGFNKEKRSPHHGLCMYGYDDLLTKSGVADASHYSVTKFVYATAELKLGKRVSKETTWMGYVAVATDERAAALGRRDIVVAWRGTLTMAEAIKDLVEFVPASAKSVLGSAAAAHRLAFVHSGFLSVYTTSDPDSELGKTSARDQVFEEVRRLVELYKGEDKDMSITVVGHSLGASLSILNAVDLVSNGVNKGAPVTAVVFACPHVGNQSFKDAFDSFKDLKALHVKNKIDLVPKLMEWLPDLGVTLPIDTSLSPYIKDPKGTAHNLECYLHGIAAATEEGGFDLVVDRDPALLNRDADVLKDEYPVPPSWWVPEHKNMVKNDKGRWELKDFEQI